jgi:hypothetical protein
MLHHQFTKLSSISSIPKTALGIGLAVLLAGSSAPSVFANDPAENLPTIQIFKKVKDNYASMVTYSDEGSVVIMMNGASTVHFSTRLARTNSYLIEWTGVGDSPYLTDTRGHAVWSSGVGDYLQSEGGAQLQRTRAIALAHGAISSGGVTARVPGMFFEQRWENQPVDDLAFTVTRLADEKVGDFNCYVFTRGAMGATNTIWVGSQDFLIHQVRTVAHMKSMPAATFTETHTNIVLNRNFSRSDFVPAFPPFQSADNQ